MNYHHRRAWFGTDILYYTDGQAYLQRGAWFFYDFSFILKQEEERYHDFRIPIVVRWSLDRCPMIVVGKCFHWTKDKNWTSIVQLLNTFFPIVVWLRFLLLLNTFPIKHTLPIIMMKRLISHSNNSQQRTNEHKLQFLLFSGIIKELLGYQPDKFLLLGSFVVNYLHPQIDSLYERDKIISRFPNFGRDKICCNFCLVVRCFNTFVVRQKWQSWRLTRRSHWWSVMPSRWHMETLLKVLLLLAVLAIRVVRKWVQIWPLRKQARTMN